MTRRVLKWVFGILLVVVALPIVAVGVALIVANTGPGRRLIQNQTASLTSGMVRIQGLAGRFPDALKADQIQLSDAEGPYLTITGLILDWSPTQLLRRTAEVDRLRADRLEFSRLPKPEAGSSSSDASFSLPVQVDLRELQIDQAVIGAQVAGARLERVGRLLHGLQVAGIHSAPEGLQTRRAMQQEEVDHLHDEGQAA